tara:strand:+ start:71 stop:622 length:552 start_codon:yes stop_codon:yes gene_type:complete
MKQKTKFLILISATFSLIGLFLWYNVNKKNTFKKLKNEIEIIDLQLNKNKNILNEIIKIENNLFQKRDTLISKLSYGESISIDIESMKRLAKSLKIELKKIQIKSNNTFPSEYKSKNNQVLPLERQTLSFQLSGKFLSIGKFLENQNNDFENIFLSQCVFNMDSLDPKGIIAQLEYNIYGDIK